MSDLKTNLQEILQEKQNKIVPENIKKDVQIFDVTGTYEGSGSSGGGDVKLFETEEEMQADSTAQEGDLAVVYREEIQNMTADTQTQYITFPETVVLPEAMTNSAYCMLRAADESVMFEGQVSLNANRFSFSGYTETGMIRVMYESSDGITYTRTSFSGGSGDLTNPVDLGTSVKVYRSEEWNDNMGYFMQSEGGTFDGLYHYEYSPNEDYISFVTNISKSEPYYEYSEPINVKAIMDKFMEKLIPLNTGNYNGILIYDDTNSSIIFYKSLNQLFGTLTSDDTDVLSINGGTYSSPQTTSKVWNKYVYDINEDNITQSTVTSPSTTAYTAPGNSYSDNMYLIDEEIDPSKLFAEVYVYTDSNNYEVTTRYIAYKVYDYVNNSKSGQINLKAKIGELLTWIYAKTQFNLMSPEQLLPNISAYGKNGNVIGDGSIYDNLDLNAIWSNILNISTPISDIADGYKLLSDNISSNKLFSGIINAEAKNYMCKTSSTGVPLGNIFGVSSEYVVVGVGTNLIYYSKRRWDSDIIVYSYNTSTFEIKTYNIPYTKENYDAYVSATNGYIYVGYITDYPQGSNGWVYKVTVSALDTNTNEYTQLYTNTLVKSSTMDMYAINGIALVMHHYISNYSVIRVNAAEHEYGNFLPDYTGWSSSYQSCYSLDGNIIYMPGIYNNSSSNRMVYDKSSNLDAYYTDSSTSVTGWATERLIPNYGNKYILGIKQHTSSDTDKLIIYNRSSHTITANDLGTDFLSSSDKWIAIKNNILYLEQYQINLDTYKVTKSHFLHSTYYLPTISNDNNLIVGNAPSIAGKYIVKSTPIDIGSIDLTKKPDFIFSYPYTNNSASNNIPILVDNTEKDYSATISPEEYNTALDTSEQILGEEETVNE